MYRSPSAQRLSSQSSSHTPRGVESLSMRMLNANLNEVQGSNSKYFNTKSDLNIVN